VLAIDADAGNRFLRVGRTALLFDAAGLAFRLAGAFDFALSVALFLDVARDGFVLRVGMVTRPRA